MNELAHLLKIQYDIADATISSLEGYANANYKVELPDGQRFVLKEHKAEEGLSALFIAEGNILSKLSGQFPDRFQEPILARDGNYLVKDGVDGASLYRMLRWVDGSFYYSTGHTPELFRSVGEQIAKMNIILQGESYPIIEARRIQWDLQYLTDLEGSIKLIRDPLLRKKVHYFMLQYKLHVLPQLSKLRRSVIHNDLNDWNLLVKENALSGIIDFGDIVYAPVIQELAVHLTYALIDKEEPLQWASYVLESYHKALPLTSQELDLLYHMIAGRMCLSLISSAQAKIDDPDNDYLSVSEEQIVRLINRWLEINPDRASNVFRSACGMPDLSVENIEESLNRRFTHISKAQSVSYSNPIKMNRAAFQYMYDEYGNTFLDAYNNIPHVGHSHPKIVEGGIKQMSRLNTNTRYIYNQLADYSEKLLAKFPAPLNKVFFVNSGSAASDLAIRMAQTFADSQNIMVMEHGYHGHTRSGIDISHYKFGRAGGRGQADYILKTEIPDTYRGKYTRDDGTAGKQYARDAAMALDDFKHPIAAFIAEPIVGCAGQVPLAKDYLKHVYPVIRQQGGVCISDEVQTGFGRLGSVFWGFELQEVIPDIVVLGKPMGNGHPMAAVVTTDEIANSFDNGMEFFSSFGGNPVSCAIGQAVLEVIEEEDLQKNALVTGSYFIHQLNKLKTKYECIGDVRGNGLFLGIEFVKDRETKAHDTDLANTIKNRMREKLILVSTDGPRDNIIKMKPPLCFNHSNVDTVIRHLDRILSSI